MTLPYAEVIGDPVAHSLSPTIHRFWLRKLGVEADYRAVRVTADGLPTYLHERRRDPTWRGCNVTMPLKAKVVPFLSWLDREASLIGVANTVVHGADTELHGHNTDVAGFAEPLLARRRLERHYPNHVATYVQVIGAGGAARAAVRGAVLAGYGDFEFYNRTLSGAQEMAALLGLPEWFAAPLEALQAIRNREDGPEEQRYSHIVVNATAMGMHGFPPVPIDLATYYSDTIVYEMVYAPLETPLLDQARRYGLHIIDGLEMLVGQAAAAFELFFGLSAPREYDVELRSLLTA